MNERQPGPGPSKKPAKVERGASRGEGDPRERSRIVDAIGWAIDASGPMAAADWLARDVAPGCAGAVALVSDPDTPLETLRRAKDAFKTLRVVGETAADRKLGGRLYVAAIAAALVHRRERISGQSRAALVKGLHDLRRQTTLPEPLRDLAELALACVDAEWDARPERPRNE